jgi:hypothetical protein
MSWGIVICSKCHREVHRDLHSHAWYHCEDKTPRCKGASSIYPRSRRDIKGRDCWRDEPPENRGGMAAV